MIFPYSTVNSSAGNHFPVAHSQLRRWKRFSRTAQSTPALEMIFLYRTVNSSTGNHSPAQQGQLQGWKSFSYTAKEIAAQQAKFPHCNCMIRQPVRQRNKAMRSPGEYRGCLAGASPGDPRHDGLATVA